MNTLDFLHALYGTAEDGWLTLNYLHGGMRTEFYPVTELDRVAKRAAALAQARDVWYGVATRRHKLPRGRGGAADCYEVPALWLDVDVEGPGHKTDNPLPASIEDAYEFIARHPLEPSLLVSTGGGLHAYWLLDELTDAGNVAQYLPGWHAMWQEMADDEGWVLDNTADLARILRLPGTYNYKTGEPVPVEVIS